LIHPETGKSKRLLQAMIEAWPPSASFQRDLKALHRLINQAGLVVAASSSRTLL
jgi:hypothetical protein